MSSTTPLSSDASYPRNPREHPHTCIIKIIGLHYHAADSMGLSAFIFGVGPIKRIFSTRVRISRSRSSRIINFGTNLKRACEFLLVRHSNLGPILHRFGAFASFICAFVPTPIPPLFWGVPIAPDRPCWGQQAHRPKP